MPLIHDQPTTPLFWFVNHRASSKNKSLIRWRTVIVGLILQQLLALAVLKSKAG
jgi:nucleoside permease NupC